MNLAQAGRRRLEDLALLRRRHAGVQRVELVPVGGRPRPQPLDELTDLKPAWSTPPEEVASTEVGGPRGGAATGGLEPGRQRGGGGGGGGAPGTKMSTAPSSPCCSMWATTRTMSSRVGIGVEIGVEAGHAAAPPPPPLPGRTRAAPPPPLPRPVARRAVAPVQRATASRRAAAAAPACRGWAAALAGGPRGRAPLWGSWSCLGCAASWRRGSRPGRRRGQGQ
eukprot:scaffold84613_cov55-Phaeocystis_antarctica.AAC.1